MACPLSAVIFDVDGTLVDTERDGHRTAFNQAFAEHGLPYRWAPAEYGRLLRITGGRRRIATYLREHEHPGEIDSLAADLHATKTTLFRRWVIRGSLRPRPGVPELLADLARAGCGLAVATTGTRAWVEPLLDRLFPPGTFRVVITGDDVRHLKPEPEAYRHALAQLNIPASAALAVEDSAIGLRAARSAGLACLVTTNSYTLGQDFTGAAHVINGFAAADRQQSVPSWSAAACFQLHARWWSKATGDECTTEHNRAGKGKT